MDDGLAPQNEDKLRALRNNLEKISLQSDFRKKVIGGLSEEDVIKYIDGLRQQSQMVENELSHYIEELESATEKLRKEYEEFRQESREEKDRLQELADRNAADSARFIQEYQDQAVLYNSEIDKMTDENYQLMNERNDLAEQVLELEQELKRLNTCIAEYSNEKTIYVKQITDLEQDILDKHNELEAQIKLGEDIEQKLEFEKARTASAAKEMNILKQKIAAVEEDLIESLNKIEEEQKKNRELEQELESEKNKVNSGKETINTMASKIGELEEQLIENTKMAEEYLKIKEELEQELELGKLEVSTCNETINNQILRTVELEEQLFENMRLAEEYLKAKEELEQELSAARENTSQASSKVMNFKGEVDVIYKQLDNIKVQIDINDKLQQQLDYERSRAEKVEKDMSQFSEWIYNLKEKFQTNQQQLEAQFNKIEDKHRAMQSDINGLRSNLESFSVGTGTELDNLCATVDCSNQMPENKCVKIDQWREKTGTIAR